MIQVDSSVIGIGWVINQQLEDQLYPIVFGSLMFNPIKSRYSQLKLELYSVLRAFKAERHRLHSIHFKLQVDASSIIQMVNAPDLLNAAMIRWIMHICLFSFEVEHVKAEKHQVPDGLSQRPQSDEDSDQSDSKLDIEDGIKLVELFSGDFK